MDQSAPTSPLESLMPPHSVGTPTRVAVLVGLGVAIFLALIVFFVYYMVRRSRQQQPPQPQPQPQPHPQHDVEAPQLAPPMSAIELFPLVQFHVREGGDPTADRGDECHVCLTEFAEGDMLRMLPCGHCFCLVCAASLFTHQFRYCPVCHFDLAS
ncbi:hypothetical protein Tsubulata_012378 [Turnera subulata]|uniref:RING-type domain-containing protein n=1 Tax=Turnera subulata TaxID=218843 RepID=A0A9Q0FXE8_9ROSI|nr:hypothetical protein Tsubulata_012378 [Turnera subulata]